MEERAWFSYAFFVMGIEFIYWNMKWSGINHPRNPAWSIVSWIHVIAIGSVIAVTLLWCLLYVDFPRSFKEQTQKNEKADKSKIIIDENRSDLKKLTEQVEIEKQNQIKEQQKLEEQRKQEVIKRRRERSANAAAHDALDDFL